MQLRTVLWRTWRRLTARGEDFILDYEVAVLQALLAALQPEHRGRLTDQLARLDRVDRSEDGTKQIFIDDDSDARKNDWPASIVFQGSGTMHVADVELVLGEARVSAQLFLVSGRFSGCEFRFTRTEKRFERFSMRDAMPHLEHVVTHWKQSSVRLFFPFSSDKSTKTFVDA